MQCEHTNETVANKHAEETAAFKRDSTGGSTPKRSTGGSTPRDTQGHTAHPSHNTGDSMTLEMDLYHRQKIT
eukprot:scaffold14811_cov22-Tisochrysis_lutea.AAC.2